MRDASTPRWALSEKPVSTDDDRLAFIVETTTRLFELAVEHPVLRHLLSMVTEEANQVRAVARTSESRDVPSVVVR